MSVRGGHEMSDRHILVVDDDPEVARAIADQLSDDGSRCEIVNDGPSALAICRQREFDVVLTDVRMAGMDGVELLSRLKHVQPDLPVILVTAEGSIPAAVDAVKRGAFQYITKPCDPKELCALVEQALAGRGRVTRAPSRATLPAGTEELVGSSAAMQQLRAKIELVALASSPVLVLGETGTGKELVARAIQACGPRRNKPLVTINCSAMPEALAESELFGHARGAFTGAAQAHRGLFVEADGGTLLLDEVGEMSLAAQAKLLRVLQTGELRALGSERSQHVDVRVIAATHRTLLDEVKAGRFREDLYYRLSIVVLSVPPLRERPQDIPELITMFLARARARAPASPARTISPALVELLASGSWLGNVRELEGTIERLVVLARKPELQPEDIAHVRDVDSRPGASMGEAITCLDDLIRNHVEQMLARTDGNKVETARLLGIDLSTLYRWQRKWREKTV
jgi:two-component system response regulator HydG